MWPSRIKDDWPLVMRLLHHLTMSRAAPLRWPNFMAALKYDKLREKCGGERNPAYTIVYVMFMLITYFHLGEPSTRLNPSIFLCDFDFRPANCSICYIAVIKSRFYAKDMRIIHNICNDFNVHFINQIL